jgi:hypothetical protein
MKRLVMIKTKMRRMRKNQKKVKTNLKMKIRNQISLSFKMTIKTLKGSEKYANMTKK